MKKSRNCSFVIVIASFFFLSSINVQSQTSKAFILFYDSLSKSRSQFAVLKLNKIKPTESIIFYPTYFNSAPKDTSYYLKYENVYHNFQKKLNHYPFKYVVTVSQISCQKVEVNVSKSIKVEEWKFNKSKNARMFFDNYFNCRDTLGITHLKEPCFKILHKNKVYFYEGSAIDESRNWINDRMIFYNILLSFVIKDK